MFRPDRERLLSSIVWNAGGDDRADKESLSYYVDCCKYAGIDEVREGENWRSGWISKEENIAQWVKQEVS
jgi:hypothetical protein